MAHFLPGVIAWASSDDEARLTVINGTPGLVVYVSGEPNSVEAVDLGDD